MKWIKKKNFINDQTDSPVKYLLFVLFCFIGCVRSTDTKKG